MMLIIHAQPEIRIYTLAKEYVLSFLKKDSAKKKSFLKKEYVLSTSP